MTDDFTDADAKALCDALGIETKTITDATGQQHLVINEEGMRKFADLAPNPVGSHALVDQIMAAAKEAHRPKATDIDNFSVEEWTRMAAVLGVEVEVTTDTFGRPDVHLDRKAMRAFRDAALAHGFADIAAVFSKALAGPGEKK
ncbi:hypothetical protein [Streptomyces sp. NPDC059786]|uniref:hypothetical protein n=1 Tax=Streptomyces sp. NPDC059786 TaxID=3346946 RepID=UPI003667DF1B